MRGNMKDLTEKKIKELEGFIKRNKIDLNNSRFALIKNNNFKNIIKYIMLNTSL